MSWSSKAQPASASHTQEAETVSLSIAIRNDAIPLQILLSTLLGRPMRTKVFEDNEACITAARKGYSPSLRHLPRHQRLALGVVHETFYTDDDETEEDLKEKERMRKQFGDIVLEHKDTKDHKGDFFTKELPRPAFEAAVRMMKISK